MLAVEWFFYRFYKDLYTPASAASIPHIPLAGAAFANLRVHALMTSVPCRADTDALEGCKSAISQLMARVMSPNAQSPEWLTLAGGSYRPRPLSMIPTLLQTTRETTEWEWASPQ